MPRGNAPIGDDYDDPWKALGGWFLGPRAENGEVFMSIFKDIFDEHVRLRKSFFPADPEYLTEEVMLSKPYLSEVEDMRDCLMKMQEDMAGNTPFFSPRYQAHMLWDSTMPSLLGYMTAMLFNQNNVDSAASPVTTQYEQEVGQQLCDMLGYNIDPRSRQPLSWGHVTCGGSVANIEALWASRNLKFIPLSIKAALLNDDPLIGPLTFLSEDQVRIGLKTQLLVGNSESERRNSVALVECTTWQLLNVDVDEILDLEQTVCSRMRKLGKVDNIKLNGLIENEGVMNEGLFDFMRKHGLEHSPVYTCPANNHYSWPKAGTLLGLGCKGNIPINLDTNFRQNLAHLKEVLEKCLKEKKPVIAVVAVIGSTEESAVDPIKDMYALREVFKEKGLNFALLADGAWGGYFKTMLIGAPAEDVMMNTASGSFVPYCKLSPYVEEQYRNIQLADTITIDPHKSGFCPYPGGALCYRNNKMRYPIAFSHPVVLNGEGDPNLGVYGIEGSKPGAAPAGILMSHKVIGLSNFGYGRILGQCTTISKIFYALWLTVAKDDDPFVCVPLQNVPEGYNITSARKLIKETIAYKQLSEIFQNQEAKNFLTTCGPDTLINTFVVNFKGNTDIRKCNKLQDALSDAMNVFVGSNAGRVPLMLMESGLKAKAHGEGLSVFKEKLGLDQGDEDLNVMVNTCMNPWQSNESAFEISDSFRMVVLNAIGRIEDDFAIHKFVLCDQLLKNEIFIEYMTCNGIPEHHYQATVKVRMSNSYKEMVKKYRSICRQDGLPVVFETLAEKKTGTTRLNLHELLHRKDSEFRMKFSHDAAGNTVIFKVVDIPRYQRLDLSSSGTYPEKQKFFIYGDSTRTIMSHVMSKLPDFQYTAILSKRPDYLTQRMLELGVVAEMDADDGSILLELEEGKMKPTQEGRCYSVSFRGELNATICTKIDIQESVYFNKIENMSVKVGS
ncbi:L-tyrosine decarboxylase-like [Bolinopsis microptera]|uniref:L-tyrosine decarboxylase-like n=1 Tax=Bolinopsis microptera TaxID=2820187 RepID=UPI00307B0A40